MSELPNPRRLVLSHDSKTGAPAAIDEKIQMNIMAPGQAVGRAYIQTSPIGKPSSALDGIKTEPDSGPVHSTGVSSSFLDMGPGVEYPMHFTHTQDYVVVITGEPELGFHDGTWRKFHPGELAICVAAAHSWRNTTDKWVQTATALTSFVEVIIHTILCIRQVYPPTTFTRRRAHGVPVYQSRHPQVREYVAEVTALIGKEMDKGNARRITLVIKTVDTGLPLERFIIDLGYLAMNKVAEAYQRETPLIGAPGADELSLMLRGFLIRLTALDGQLEDNRGETTFAIIVETQDDLEPISNNPTDGSVPPWIPALAADTIRPLPSDAAAEDIPHHEPLLNVKAVETGVIDECVAKTGVLQLRVGTT
ncbi:MAG: hypothetical protein TREMPRED_005398 [Tremellales sp. Tagirdzhanova-0007]|nr:MAG: hypothetical protein TREMPRED_005398 [Tremellales sp. Tagirdzhanova-0007]